MVKGVGRQSGEVMGVYDLHSCHFMCAYFTPNSSSCIAQCKKYSFLQVDYISIKWLKKKKKKEETLDARAIKKPDQSAENIELTSQSGKLTG